MDSAAATRQDNQPLAGRRRLVFGGAAVAAVAAGAGFAWWRTGLQEASSPAPASLWASTFDTPQGQPLAMQSLRGKPLLINFWATWCPPCIEEMPLIDAFYRQNRARNWQVLGLAIDQPSAVKAFLAKRPVSFPIALAGFEGTELVASLGNPSGGLPFTVVVSPHGNLLYRKMGRVTVNELADWGKLA